MIIKLQIKLSFITFVLLYELFYADFLSRQFRFSAFGVTPGIPANPLTSLVGALTTGIGGLSGSHATPMELQTGNILDPGALSFYNTHSTSDSTTKPKAFINWVLFDEQFKYVSSSSGFEQVGADNTLTVHTRTDLPVSKNGYLYIYTSNETPNIDVFFDNLQVTHIRGPILEETHYYPFGLIQSGISSKALAFGQPENKKKYQQYEFNSDFDINLYESFYRSHDPQLGRFWQIDPKPYCPESPYVAMGDNPIKNFDILGDELGGADRESANRQKDIITNSAAGEDGAAFRKLIKLKKDGMTFKKINQKKLNKAIAQIKDDDQRSLAKGYGKAINSSDQMFVRVINRNENPDIENKKMSKEWSTNPNSDATTIGRAIDDKKGGGNTQFMDGQSLSVIVMNSTFETTYENKSTGETVMAISSAAETSSHEILGHALGKFSSSSTFPNQDAIQMSNLYRRANGDNILYRTGAVHPPGNIRMTTDEANRTPDYLKE